MPAEVPLLINLVPYDRLRKLGNERVQKDRHRVLRSADLCNPFNEITPMPARQVCQNFSVMRQHHFTNTDKMRCRMPPQRSSMAHH